MHFKNSYCQVGRVQFSYVIFFFFLGGGLKF